LRGAVAFNYLRSDWRSREPQALANFLFDLRTKMVARAHRAGNFPYSQLLRGNLKAREITAIFRVPIGDFQAKSDRFSVDSVRAADLGRVFKFPGAPLEDFAQRFDFFLDQMRGFADEQGLRGVHHIIRSEAVVQPARSFRISHRFLHRDGEGDYVMANFGFDFVDARDIHTGALTKFRGSLGRY